MTSRATLGMSRPRFSATWVALLLVLAGCAGGSSTSATTTDTRAAASASLVAAVSEAAAQASADTAVPEIYRFAASTVKGEVFEGPTLAGRPQLIWFWASWCPICNNEVGHFRNAVHGVEAQGVNVLTVAGLNSNRIEGMVWADERLIGDLVNLYDGDGGLYLRFGVTAQNSFAFVNSDGSFELVNASLSTEDIVSAVAKLT